MSTTPVTFRPNGQMSLGSSGIESKGIEDWMLSGVPVSAKRRRFHMTISPTLAKSWMESANTNNRNLSETTVTQYACDMIDGRWEDNGDAIRFSREGVLLDGQHRLKACMEAGIPFETDVIFGLKKSARDTIDIGRVRTAADIVQFEGVQNAVSSCALAHMLLIHREYGIHRMNNADVKPTKTKVIQLARADARIPEIAGRLSTLGKRLIAPRVMTFCYYLFSSQDQGRCDQFFQDLTTGANLLASNPVYVLRERLVANGQAKAKLPVLEIIALFFKAWVAFRDGKQIRVLRWRTNGLTPEPFPKI